MPEKKLAQKAKIASSNSNVQRYIYTGREINSRMDEVDGAIAFEFRTKNSSPFPKKPYNNGIFCTWRILPVATIPEEAEFTWESQKVEVALMKER
ncbi:hypothetical protein PN499_18390 [Kamptonema animale CS-326]|jgi:hypothetical protein|uniref:hypothetical protein n=1 Tax=Kamptonema animale TaxID=92934 RepID=UPI00232EB591|nr:hypothetical protein [Kamptonema animale]MDB9513166.1 hypothetical protein [Kamptonema animale CS-326]